MRQLPLLLQKGEKPLLLGVKMESVLASLTFCSVNTSLQGSGKLQLFDLEMYPRSWASLSLDIQTHTSTVGGTWGALLIQLQINFPGLALSPGSQVFNKFI